MNTALLLPWLKLPPGPWPPEERALLGLPAGPIDSAQAEMNALARMEMLRPHQLKHPEVVTEGMNRLAQALIALTSTVDANAPTVALRKPARRSAPKPKPVEAPQHLIDLSPIGATAPISPPPPAILEAEVIVEAEIVRTPLLPTVPLLLPEPILAIPPGLVEVPEIPQSDDRRRSYRQLAYLRKLHAAWLTLQNVLAVPSEPLLSAEMVYRALIGFRDLRELLRRGRPRYKALERIGGSVLALAGQPQAISVLRELLPDQRQAVAMDWAYAKASLEAQMVAVRQSLKRPRTRHALADAGRLFTARLQQNPEWILGVLTTLLILSGIARTLLRG